MQEKLGDSQEQSNTPEKSEKDVEKAVEQQKKVVEKMQEAIDKANDANRRFEAGTFVNRLKKAAGEQNGIVASLNEAFERMLGLKTPALDPSDARRLNENSRQQMDTASDVRWIQEDLGHFYARTQTETFKQIMDEMRESGIDIGLEDVRTRLSDNRSFEAAEAVQKMGRQAQRMGRRNSKARKTEAAVAAAAMARRMSEDEDFEFMLRVMKMIQQEQDLRARTRVLEQLRRDLQPAGGTRPSHETFHPHRPEF